MVELEGVDGTLVFLLGRQKTEKNAHYVQSALDVEAEEPETAGFWVERGHLELGEIQARNRAWVENARALGGAEVQEQVVNTSVVLHHRALAEPPEALGQELCPSNVVRPGVSDDEVDELGFDDEVTEDSRGSLFRHEMPQEPHAQEIEQPVRPELEGEKALHRHDREKGEPREDSQGRPEITPRPAAQVSHRERERFFVHREDGIGQHRLENVGSVAIAPAPPEKERVEPFGPIER